MTTFRKRIPRPKNFFLLLASLLVFVLVGTRVSQGLFSEEPALVPLGEHVSGPVATVQRDILVQGHVAGDVTSWIGAIHVQGHVAGDVVSYGGDVTIDPTARVGGSVLAFVGDVQTGTEQTAQTTIAGQVLDPTIRYPLAANIASVPGHTSAIPPFSVVYAIEGVALTLFALVLTAASLTIWPRRTARTSQMLLYAPWHSLVLGGLTTLLLAGVLLVLSALLAITLIGLPLIVLVVLVLHLPYIYGLSVLAQAFSYRLSGADQAMVPMATPLVGTLILLLLVLLLSVLIAPLWGVALFYTLASAGIGAVILSRGGSIVPLAQGNRSP